MGPRKNRRGPIAGHHRVPEIQAPGWFPGGDPEPGPRKYGALEWGMGRESAGPAKAGPWKRQEMGPHICGAPSGERGGAGNLSSPTPPCGAGRGRNFGRAPDFPGHRPPRCERYIPVKRNFSRGQLRASIGLPR